jgi:myo-inositol-1(or 4)-monophosphatase
MHPLLSYAIGFVREAGEAILASSEKKLVLSNTQDKGILAEGDIVAHKVILEKIKEKFPEHSLISEEGDINNNLASDTWICDPICGSYNYTQGVPYFATGLSYLKDGKVQISIIYNPATKELFYAVKDNGAYLNEEKIKVSNKDNLKNAVINFNSNFSSVEGCEKGKELFLSLCPPVTSRLRLTESANLDLAYVACGRYDAYIHPSDKVWDKTAGKLLIEEAGGQVLDFAKSDQYSIFGRGVIATNGKITEQLKSAVFEMLN